ncbi:uncharacterized protein EURHEDRAFT_91682 [Aspergillus ruber CBS 135680]|uniref:Uncharacterized protein n=1 Tax=Aspergillus ruber (strain CBS 135680) TaxID=1388766 RepID=A0A017SBP5_ASPRC|nr:uncharacterized protein EURHEDRAFT_91682 [Aspergillus ruber CBS 135680]EYE94463.1 hypothetical protein EURHEDRAFT_91682 [Aspergillus ruber CBS 135680]
MEVWCPRIDRWNPNLLFGLGVFVVFYSVPRSYSSLLLSLYFLLLLLLLLLLSISFVFRSSPSILFSSYSSLSLSLLIHSVARYSYSPVPDSQPFPPSYRDTKRTRSSCM